MFLRHRRISFRPTALPFFIAQNKKNTETTAFVLKPSLLSLFFRSRFSEKRLRMQSAHDG